MNEGEFITFPLELVEAADFPDGSVGLYGPSGDLVGDGQFAKTDEGIVFQGRITDPTALKKVLHNSLTGVSIDIHRTGEVDVALYEVDPDPHVHTFNALHTHCTRCGKRNQT